MRRPQQGVDDVAHDARYAGSNSQPNSPSTDKPSTMNRPTGSIFSKRAPERVRQQSPRRTRPPSSGGMGSRLKTASNTLIKIPACAMSAIQCRPGLLPLTCSNRREHAAPEQRHEYIGGGPGQRHHIIARRGLRSTLVATGTGFAQPNSGRADGQQDAGHQHRADRIDVPQRIQTQAPEHLGGAVAEVSGHPAVRHFMQGDRKQHRDCIDRNLVKKCR